MRLAVSAVMTVMRPNLGHCACQLTASKRTKLPCCLNGWVWDFAVGQLVSRPSRKRA